MKITGIKVRQVEVPLIEPFRISLGVITHSRSAIVSVETGEGLVGYGEGAPAILISGESLSGTNDVIKAMERELIGVDPTDLEKVYWIMDRTAAHSGSAKNAIDMACFLAMISLARKQVCQCTNCLVDTRTSSRQI